MTLRVLVVDDDPGLREVLETALAMEGYDVVLATDGSEAMEKLTAARPDLILFDLSLPRMNGEAFANELQRVGLRPSIPVMLLTGDVRGRQLAHRIGAEAYLEKPFALPDLLDAVARLTSGAAPSE